MSTDRKSLTAWLGAAAAIALTAAGTFVLVRVAPVGMPDPPVAAMPKDGPNMPRTPGVEAALRAGDAAVSRRLPAAAFAVEPGQTLDLRLPPGPFEADLEVTFDPGPVRRAAVGAEIEGASLVIERGGAVLATGKGGEQPAAVLSAPVFIAGAPCTFTFRLRSSGHGAVRLRGLWQPEGTALPVALPAVATAGEAADLGYALVRELNCAACHPSGDPALQAALGGASAPNLVRVGARARAPWMRRWIAGPSVIRPEARMPALLDPSADSESIEDLVHYLASREGGPIETEAGAGAGAGLIETGRALYHRIGCAACHGALDPPAPSRHAQAPLGLAAKTSAAALAAFLADPVAVRPGGEMPAQGLSEIEAESIAAYLLSIGPPSAGAAPAFVPDGERVRRGERLFAETGCANCHSLGLGLSEIEPRLAAAPLESLLLSGSGPGGCLADVPVAPAPDYGLPPEKRAAIAAFLETLPDRRSADVPHLRLASDLDRLHCLACHSAGPAGGPEPRLRPLFATRLDVDLGDEGRLPPDLHDVGARLDPAWLSEVLLQAGTARPWMATRMPQYGAAAGDLAGLLVAAAGASARPDPGPAADAAAAAAGRGLVGSGGFNCVQCHAVDGNQAALPGVDLARMPRRLRYEHFARVLSDPKLMNPGTRMPGFFSGGRSGLTGWYEGDETRQVEALWSYLSRAGTMALPEGLAGSGDFALEPGDRPIVLRTFMKDAGPRAIACGYPEGVHAAFDADLCMLRLAWVGRFLDAEGAWGARGGSETNPSQPPSWVATTAPRFTVAVAAGGAPVRAGPRYRGYRLDAGGRPIFEYDVVAPGVTVRVSEQPVPRRDGDAAWIERRFEMHGPAGAVITVDLARDGPSEVRLDAAGQAAFVAEVRW